MRYDMRVKYLVRNLSVLAFSACHTRRTCTNEISSSSSSRRKRKWWWLYIKCNWICAIISTVQQGLRVECSQRVLLEDESSAFIDNHLLGFRCRLDDIYFDEFQRTECSVSSLCIMMRLHSSSLCKPHVHSTISWEMIAACICACMLQQHLPEQMQYSSFTLVGARRSSPEQQSLTTVSQRVCQTLK